MRRKPRRRQTAKPFSLPAPIGGLNGRDGLAAMPPLDAYVLDNWFPSTTSVDCRRGHQEYATGAGGPVETLMVYTGGTTPKMLACANGSMFDASTTGILPAALTTGRTNNQIQYANFSNAGAKFLVGVNGADEPFSYNGAVYAGLVITGVTGGQNNLSDVHAFKGRLYFAAKGVLGFYYLPVGNIQGAASFFDLSQFSGKGGYVVAITSATHDGGNGPADYMVFITSEGEYIVYGGFDPSSAASWEIVGRYYSAPPVGPNCVVQYGTDLLIITEEGLLPFASIKSDAGVDARNDAISSKLGKLLSAHMSHASVFGWQVFTYSAGGMLILNVPVETTIAGKYYQYVMNTTTNAWARFKNQNGICWAVFQKKLYFGDYAGKIWLADSGATDNGADILADAKQAYNPFDEPNKQKQYHFAKLFVTSDGTPPLNAALNVDYHENSPSYTSLLSADPSAWDVADWDTAAWGAEADTQTFLANVGNIGTVCALWVRASVNSSTLQWYSTQFIYTLIPGLF